MNALEFLSARDGAQGDCGGDFGFSSVRRRFINGRARRRLKPQMMLLESLAQASYTMLRQANRRHDVVAVQVTDRARLELPELGRLILQDAETGEIVEVNTGDARKRAAFAAAGTKSRSNCSGCSARRALIRFNCARTKPIRAALGRFFENREKRRLRG